MARAWTLGEHTGCWSKRMGQTEVVRGPNPPEGNTLSENQAAHLPYSPWPEGLTAQNRHREGTFRPASVSTSDQRLSEAREHLTQLSLLRSPPLSR